MGWIIEHYGFASAFGTAACLSALALPYFLFADSLLQRRATALRSGTKTTKNTKITTAE
jgi:hypothetical protein